MPHLKWGVAFYYRGSLNEFFCLMLEALLRGLAIRGFFGVIVSHTEHDNFELDEAVAVKLIALYDGIDTAQYGWYRSWRSMNVGMSPAWVSNLHRISLIQIRAYYCR